MNFKDMKDLMDADKMYDNDIPENISDIPSSKMPIRRIRKKIIGEIITQLLCILVFFTLPTFISMHELPKAIYYLLIGLTSLITLGYLRRMIMFLYLKNNLSGSTKESITNYLFEFRLMIETYKTACISGSLLLPLAMMPVFLGKSKLDPNVFQDFILFDVSSTTLIYYILGYLAVAIVFEVMTKQWIKSIYGCDIKDLENLLKQLND